MKTLKKIKPNVAKALMLAKREVGVLAHDSVLLEGINITLPEMNVFMRSCINPRLVEIMSE